MTELTLGLLDDTTGSFLIDDELPAGAKADLAPILGSGEGVGCARPSSMTTSATVARDAKKTGPTVRINGFWHDDFMVGPGRRSVVRFQGCPIRCIGCWVPETHDFDGGHDVPIELLADHLLNTDYERDGVTILGGEPFAQPEALANLVRALRYRTSVMVYSGYTEKRLLAMAMDGEPFAHAIKYVLDSIDALVSSPYIQALAHGNCSCDDETRRWTGSCNQRVHHLR